VVALVDREGGSFFQEWSALFVLEEQSGGRVCFYYPRLSAGGKGSGAETAIEVAGGISSYGLHASLVALPYEDSSDGETTLCYRSYFPACAAAVY
jgi:hypothetical protein